MMSEVVGSPQQPGPVAVIDLDNLLHRGFDKKASRPRPQAQLDVLGICRALRARGVSSGTVCRNWEFSPFAEQMWTKLGFKVVAANRNCDDDVINAVETYADSGVQSVVLVAGDGDYTATVKKLHLRNVAVEVWSRSANVSRNLQRSATSVRIIDQFLGRAA